MSLGKTLSLALGLSLAATSFAAASTPRNCAERAMVLKRLSANYGESRQSIGLGANNSVVEVFASDETGTWTITVTTPNGTTCLIASGQAFESLIGEKLDLGNDV